VLDQWTQPGVLNWQLTFASAVLDPNGIDVYLVGGSIGGGPQSFPPGTTSPYIIKYNTQTTTQQIIGQFSAPRTRAKAVGIGPNIYLIGGGVPNVEEFNTNSLALNPNVAAIPMLNGPMVWTEGPFIHVAGGNDGFGPQAGHFQFDPNIPGSMALLPPLPIARTGNNLTMLNDNRFYAAVGSPYLDVEAWDPMTQVWSTVGSLPTPRQNEQAIGIADELIVAGGFQNTQLAAMKVNEVGKLVPVTAVNNGGTPNGGGSTPVNVGGTTVVVTTPGGSTAGQAVVAIIDPPASTLHGFRFQGHVYDISSSAILQPGGLWEIELPYTGTASYMNGTNPNVPVTGPWPKVRHWTGSGWDQITTGGTVPSGGGTPNPALGQVLEVKAAIGTNPGSIRFSTSTLSPFGVEALDTSPTPPPASSVPASSDWSMGLAILVGLFMAALAILRMRRVA
jgi:hypothetical protein